MARQFLESSLKILELMKGGFSNTQIKSKFSVSDSRIAFLRRKLGMPLMRPGRKFGMTEEVAKLRKEIFALKIKGWTYENIGKKFGFTQQYIQQLFRPRIKNIGACSVCGVWSDRLSRHHSDYSLPGEVKLICGSCHGKIHHPKGRQINGRWTEPSKKNPSCKTNNCKI